MGRQEMQIRQYRIAYGTDHALGGFLQVFDETQITEENDEGLVIDIDTMFGINVNKTTLEPSTEGSKAGNELAIKVMDLIKKEGQSLPYPKQDN